MSTIIHPGTTGTTGPSGRLLGLVAAGLAVAIALGFVFANNQANEATESAAVVTRSITADDALNSQIEFLTRQHQAQAARRSDTNIELYKLQTAGLVGAGNEITPSVSPEAVKALQGRPQVNVSSILSAVPAAVFSPELARLQSANSGRLQEMWSVRYQDMIDRFENLMVPQGQAVYSAQWPQGFSNLMDQYETRIAEAVKSAQPQGFSDLMDQYEARIAEGNATDDEPVKLPRNERH